MKLPPDDQLKDMLQAIKNRLAVVESQSEVKAKENLKSYWKSDRFKLLKKHRKEKLVENFKFTIEFDLHSKVKTFGNNELELQTDVKNVKVTPPDSLLKTEVVDFLRCYDGIEELAPKTQKLKFALEEVMYDFEPEEASIVCDELS